MSKIGYIDITGTIDANGGGFFDWGSSCSAKDVQQALVDNKDAEELIVSINSGGGSCDEGFAIFNLLTNSGKKITTRAVGTCASIASVIFLAGSKREIFDNTQVMIHLPMIMPYEPLNETEIDKLKNQLAQEKDRILNLYVDRTGADRDTLDSYMVDETYLTADQAIELKFATEIVKPIMAVAKNKFNMKINHNSNAAKAVKVIASLLGVEITDEEVKNIDLTTTDGKILSIDPALEVGATVQMDGADAPDGDYTMESGEVVTVAGGKITAIVPAASDDAKDTEIANLKAELEALKATNTQLTETNNTLTADVANMKEENEAVAKQVNDITAHLKTLNVDFKAVQTTNFNNDNKPTPYDAEAEKKRKAEIKAKAGKLK